MPRRFSWAGARRQGGNWSGIFVAAAGLLARGVPAGGLDAAIAGSSHGGQPTRREFVSFQIAGVGFWSTWINLSSNRGLVQRIVTVAALDLNLGVEQGRELFGGEYFLLGSVGYDSSLTQ